MERPSFVGALSVPSLRAQMVEVARDQNEVGQVADVLIERYTYMLRHGCEGLDCAYCPRGKKRPTVYAARAFAQQYVMFNKPVCPRIADLYVPLINFSRPAAPESLIMRVRSGKIPQVEAPVPKPNIGINIRPQHVNKQKPKLKEPIKEKTVESVGQYKLRRLSGQTMEKVIEITNYTKDDSFLRQILNSLSDVRLLTQSFLDPPRFRTHRNLITNQASVHLIFDELDRRHLPLLFDSFYRALHDPEMAEISFSQEIHCIHLAWQALASSENALEIGGRPLAITLIEIQTREPNFKARFDAFSVFLSNYEMLCAEPIIRMIQSLLVYKWDGQFVVGGLRAKCLTLLSALYARHSTNSFLARLFVNEIIAKTALSERHQRAYAEAFSYKGQTLLDHPYLFSQSNKIALFEFWVVANMEHQHKQGWGLRRLARHFYNIGFRFDYPQSAYFGMNIERQDLIHDVTRAIAGQSTSVLRRPMKVRYTGEQGIDLAGLTADLLSRVIKATIVRCLEMNLLRESSCVWFQEGAQNPGEFKRLGMLIGLAMYNGVKSLPLDFPLMFYKKVVGEPLVLDDMAELDPQLHRGWRHVLENDVEDLSFEYTYQIGSEVQTHVLEYQQDAPRVVTPGNRSQFVQSLFNAATNTLVNGSFDALLCGLESIIPRRALRLFTASELRSFIAGQRIVDVPGTVEQLKQVTVYEGFSPDDPVIQNLWSILSNGTPTQFAQFLDLATASDRLPTSFPANFKLTIFKSGSDEEMFPRGQTCMHGLGLPAYRSAEKLREKLFIALESFAAPGGDAFHLD